MPAAYQTRTIDADAQALWRIVSDLAGYDEWMVLPAGRVTSARVIQDAGALTRSARRLEVEGGRWFEEEVSEAAAPTYVAFRVLRDSTGQFAHTYKEMTISVRIVGASGGGVNVTLGVDYAKASFIGRWTDFFGPRNWRQAFKRSLKNLAEVVSERAGPELFTPSWRQEPEPRAETPAPAPAPAAVEEEAPAPAAKPSEAVQEEAKAEEAAPAPEPDRAELEAQLTRLRTLLEQTKQMGLSTAEIEARIAEVEARLSG